MMTLKEFKALYKKCPPIEKVKAIPSVVEQISHNRCMKFLVLPENKQYYAKEEVHMRKRLAWLIEEIMKNYTKMELRLKILEERVAEAGEKQ